MPQQQRAEHDWIAAFNALLEHRIKHGCAYPDRCEIRQTLRTDEAEKFFDYYVSEEFDADKACNLMETEDF